MRIGLLALAACSSGIEVETAETGLVPVLEGPEIAHDPPVPPFVEGAPIPVQATAVDPDGVEGLELFHRLAGELAYARVPMAIGEDDVWRAEIPGEDVDPPGIEYYLRATDASAWRVPGLLPAGGPADPLLLPVGVIPTAVPYVQGFDGTTSLFGIYEVGWTEAALGFRGVRWDVGGLAFAGDGGAVHTAGYAGMDPVDDWLISPVLDFSGLQTAEVRWLEYGERTQQAGTHGLYVSTGSADPDDGEFVKVLQLLLPTEGAWTRAPVVDLTAWAGQPAVTLAWRYEGAHNDLWAIDEVRVRAFGPDLRVISATHDRVDPGGATALDVVVQNLGAPTAGPVTLDLAFDPSLASDPGPLVAQSLGTGEQLAARLDLLVSADAPDNTVLPGVLSASDGTDGVDAPVEVLVGDPTTGIVRLQTTGPGVVQVWMGTGNPLQPHVEVPVFLGGLNPGMYTFSVDLAEHIQYLPSAPGRLRWWVKLNTQEPSRLVGFGIDFDGETTWTDVTGPFPAGQDRYFYLPGRPDPALIAATTIPDPLVPGQPGTVELTLRNDGGATSGATELRLLALDDDLTLTDDRIPLADPWALDAVTTVSIPVLVAASHTDSAPLPLQVTVFDELELFPLAIPGQPPAPILVPVPWPDVQITGPALADAGGDGILDPSEAGTLTFTVRNDGALGTQALTCGLTAPGLDVPSPTASVNAIGPGGARSVPFAVTVLGGAVGDELALTLTCEEAGRTWVGEGSVVLGGQGWSALPLDPAGDALAGAPFDLRSGRWRVDGDVLSLELSGASPITLGSLNLELWLDNPGSVWPLHAVTVLGGVPQLWGVQFGGFNPLSVPVLTSVDADTVRFDLDLPSMQLAGDELTLAVGTGFCGASALYCDSWPDAWGDPYVGPVDPTLWMPLAW